MTNETDRKIDEILSIVKRHDVEFIKVHGEMDSLKQQVGSIKQDVDFMKQDMGSMRQDMDFMKQEMGSLKEEMGSVKAEIWFMKEEMGSMKSTSLVMFDQMDRRLREEREIGNIRFAQLTAVLSDVQFEVKRTRIELKAEIDKVYTTLSEDLQAFAVDLHKVKKRVDRLEKRA